MRLLFTIAIITVLSLPLVGCDGIVDDAKDPIGSASAEQLDDPGQVGFLINGIEARWNNVHDNMTVQASLLSDQFVFGGNIGGGATFPTFDQIDRGQINLDNNSVGTTESYLGQYRFLADDLLRRLDEADLDSDQGRFVGNFHSGLARYYYATYFGLEQRRGGGVITTLDNPADPTRAEFTDAEDLYDDAIVRLTTARDLAPSSFDERVINSVLARIALFRDDLEAAAAAAENGLAEGDLPFRAEYIELSGNQQNTWQSQGGPGRTQVVTSPKYWSDPRFEDDVFLDEQGLTAGGDAGLTERLRTRPLVRIPLWPAVTSDLGDAIENGFPLAQGLYLQNDDPINFITWQENNLILAEVELRLNDDEAAALSLVNAVRAVRELDPLDEVDLNRLFQERETELFATALRLPDQRRVDIFDLDVDVEAHGWHLGEDAWWYLPITEDERLNNPEV